MADRWSKQDRRRLVRCGEKQPPVAFQARHESGARDCCVLRATWSPALSPIGGEGEESGKDERFFDN
jgi:hypothetical protein